MDGITPVGVMIQPPPQQNAIQTLGGILGLKQQQLALQTGQQQLQTQTAEAQQATQKNRELTSLGQWAQKAKDDPAYRNPDGSVNIDKLQKDGEAIGGVYGAPVVGQIVNNITDSVRARQTLQNLSVSENNQISGMLKNWASHPNPSMAELMEDISTARQTNHDPGFNNALDLALRNFQPGMTPDQMRRTAGNLAATLGGFSQEQPITQQLGGGFRAATQNVFTGAQTPAGPEITTGLPAQVYAPPGGGPPSIIGGAYGTSGKPPAPGIGGGPVPSAGDWQNFAVYQNNLNQRVRVATDAQPIISETEEALKAIRNNAGASQRAAIAKSLQAFGAPQELVDAVDQGDLGKTQAAEKFLFQTTLMGLRQAMQGDPARVAEFNEANKVFPNIDTDPRAKQILLNFIDERAQRDYAEQQALIRSRSNGTFNPVTWEGTYQKELRAGQVPGVPKGQIPSLSEPAGGPKEGQTSKSKSGKPIVYRNGAWHYE